MTPYQRAAFADPCRFAFETTRDRFAHRIDATTTLVLTINSGYE